MFILEARSQEYRIDFGTMTQTNLTTRPYKQRYIRHPALRPKNKGYKPQIDMLFDLNDSLLEDGPPTGKKEQRRSSQQGSSLTGAAPS